MADHKARFFDIATLYDPREDSLPNRFGQEARPHVFVKKLRRRPGANAVLATRLSPSRDITVNEFSAIFAAAEFADQSNMMLDVSVTLDFARLNALSADAAQAALSKFLRCYAAWCNDRYLPIGWIASVEMSRALTYHAHIALFVPGVPRGWTFHPGGYSLRRDFRRWASSYTDRHIGKHVARAVKVRCGLRESHLAHWIVVTYLMKGFDRHATLCSGRNSPDGLPIELGDVIPWWYNDPGPVALNRRVSICENLGPKQRAFGAPKGFEQNLPERPDVSKLFDPHAGSAKEKHERLYARKPVPFTSSFEDRVLDVRKLYPAAFYTHVTKIDPVPPLVTQDPPLTICSSCLLADQLAALPYI